MANLHAQQAPSAATLAEPRDGITIDAVTVGFRNQIHLGQWTPLVVQLTTSRPMACTLSVTAATPDGNLATFPSKPFDLNATGTHRLETTFMSGRVDTDIVIVLQLADGERIERILRPSTAVSAHDFRVLNSEQVLIATLGNPAGFADEASAGEHSGESQADSNLETIDAKPNREVVALSSPEELPTDPTAYDSLRVLVVAGDYQWDAPRIAALREWVLGGGHLVLSVAAEREAYESSGLAEWVPVKITGEMLLRELSSLETYTKASARLPVVGRVQAVRLEPEDGVVLASSIDGPVLVRVPYGLGRVTMMGLDLNRPPLSKWDMAAVFGEHISDLYESELNRAVADRFARISTSNISDISSQLLAALETFPQVERVSIWIVIGWMVVGLAVLGLGDYLLVNYALRRPEWTWFTLPVLVVVSVSLAAWGAVQTNGDRLQVNALDVIDLDTATQTMRVQNYATIYTPETRRYRVDVRIPSDALSAALPPADAIPAEKFDVKTAWYGTPESSFGGMYRTGGFSLTRAQFSFAPEAEHIENLPIPIWSAKTLQAQARVPAVQFVESQLVSTGVGQLKGPIVHHFPVPLEDWFVAYGTRIFRPRMGVGAYGTGASSALPPNRPWDPSGAGVFQRELKGFLTGTIASRSSASGKTDQIIVEQTPYNLGGRDPFEIVKMITFYGSVGGKDYIKLTNDLFNQTDFTELMKLNRAVLFGRIDMPATALMLDGIEVAPERQTTIVRVVLPVDLQLVERRELPRMDPNAPPPKNIFKRDD